MKINIDKRIKLIVNIFGISSIGGSVFLQMIIFGDILKQGYFMAVETNPLVLGLEILLASFTLIYFGYQYYKFVKSM